LYPLFAAGVVDTGGNLPPASLTPVSTTLAKLVEKFAAGVVKSPRIFEKIRTGPNAILWGWGETDH
jgi:hypothetical protein